VQNATTVQRDPQRTTRRSLVQAAVVFTLYCLLSLASRFIPILFVLVVGVGLWFPLIWGLCTKDWKRMGFTRRNIGPALLWGLGTGLVLMGVIWFTTEHKLAPFFALQLIVGVPIWLLIMSPFQEFFFRGWLQPRFQDALGVWPGLLVTAIAFSLWHFFPLFEEAQIVPIRSPTGVAYTVGMGLVFGYIFRRTGNIIAPWLAHFLAGLILIMSGAMTFVQYVE